MKLLYGETLDRLVNLSVKVSEEIKKLMKESM